MSNVIEEIKCTDFQDFENKSKKKLCNFTDFIFRGQYDAKWPLDTSFQRFFKKVSSTSISSGDQDPFSEILEKYKKMYDRNYKNELIKDINDYAGIGQHYGLPTPYLDWTSKLNKALFFAVCDEITNPLKHRFVALYALRYKNIENLVNSYHLKELIRNNNDIKLFEQFGLYLIEPNVKLKNYRIDNQSGLFLKIDGSRNLNEDIVKIFEKAYSCYSIDKPILYKFKIPRKFCTDILKELHYKSDINFNSIYPDLEGVAKQAQFEFIINYRP